MKISSIIATYNRRDELKNLLISIKNQTYGGFEVVIVDQNADERVYTLLEELHFPSKKIKVIHYHRNNLSEARNRGIEGATGEIFFFPDDDSVLPNSFFVKVADLFEKNKEMDFLSVRVIENSTIEPPLEEIDCIPITIKNARSLTTASSVLLRREVIEDIGNFDPHLGLGGMFESSEDLDFVLRVLNKKYRGYFYTSTFIIHENPVKVYDENTARRAYRYNRGFGAVVRKHLKMVGNKYLLLLFICESLRNIVTMLIHLLRNPWRAKYNFLSLRGKIEGFLKYGKLT